jgi:hypothetical protein
MHEEPSPSGRLDGLRALGYCLYPELDVHQQGARPSKKGSFREPAPIVIVGFL